MDKDRRAIGTASSTVSTLHAPPSNEWGYWLNAIQHAWPLRLQIGDQSKFRGDWTASVVGNMCLSEIRCDAHEWQRTAGPARHAAPDSLLFFFIESGTYLAEHEGKQIRLEQGEGTCFAQLPSSGSFPQGIHMWVLEVPRSAVEAHVSCLERGVNLNLSQSSMLFPLVKRYVEELGACAAQLKTCLSPRVASNLTDLVSAMVADAIQQSGLALTEYRAAALQRVLDFIERHLDDPALDTAAVSEALQLSPRYINKLLEAKGTSLRRFMQQRRLERVADDLKNPTLATRSISAIALAHGFNNLSHFGNAFRQRYGVTPRDFRRLQTKETQDNASKLKNGLEAQDSRLRQ